MNMFTICVDYNFSAEDSYIGFSAYVEYNCSVGGIYDCASLSVQIRTIPRRGMVNIYLCLCGLELFTGISVHIFLFVQIRTILAGD
jgi:hypothetical protein